MADIRVYADSASATLGLGEFVKSVAAEAIATRGAFSVGIAGGSLVKMLAGMLDTDGIEWNKWHLFWVDERCVPHSDPESNYGGAAAALLSKVPIPDSQIHPINETLCDGRTGMAEAAARDYDQTLKALPEMVLPRRGELPAFDLLLLGFGPDGHICSLFPHHPLLGTADERWVLPIADSPKPPPERITLSLPVVNAVGRQGGHGAHDPGHRARAGEHPGRARASRLGRARGVGDGQGRRGPRR
eukprot:CAMPEP_0177619284 /NCGR_PEP_ID=MMETSP0419_2-20121207/26158_1 /TAXON_ID=582737 /ORGANISM="Tetraselmis sp., Strain GSL018" /LENGTH=243 /DNA_ID=CAMNT_0019118501 /DNA_START=90 /DNA_END=817 /DNA_ORIENTATION=-